MVQTPGRALAFAALALAVAALGAAQSTAASGRDTAAGSREQRALALALGHALLAGGGVGVSGDSWACAARRLVEGRDAVAVDDALGTCGPGENGAGSRAGDRQMVAEDALWESVAGSHRGGGSGPADKAAADGDAFRGRRGGGCDFDTEHQALLDFFYATDGPNWSQPWPVEDPNHCLWDLSSVACTLLFAGCVGLIDVNGRGLSGPIPVGPLLDLVELQILELSSNGLTGSVPSALGAHPELFILDVASNNLVGPLPPSLGNLSKLQGLDLHSNALTGSLPASLGDLSQLQGLDLHSNAITGSLPATLGDLTQLLGLDLSSNALSGTITPALGNLVQLEFLYLYSNGLTGPVPAALGDMARLQILSLSSNALSGTIAAGLADLGQLHEFDVSSNALGGTIAPALGNLAQLEIFDLHSNAISGTLPVALGDLARLEILDLHSNAISGTIATALADLAQLQEFDLSSNSLSGGVPAFPRQSLLREVRLASNQLTSRVPSLSSHLFVVVLDLALNRLTGPIPADLASSSRVIETIDLSQNGLSGPIPGALADFATLTTLNLDANALTSIPEELGRSALRRLDLSRNLLPALPLVWIQDDEFTGADDRLEAAEDVFSALESARLDGNPLDMDTTDFVRVFKAFQRLAVLTCSACGLHGALDELVEPYVFAESTTSFETRPPFPRLIQLDLSDNSLTGALPSSPLPTLLLFAASNTQLSSVVPSSWLELALLALDGTAAVAEPDAWRNETAVSDVVASFGSYTCRPLLGVGGRVLTVDASFVEYETCMCADGFFGLPPACEPCPVDTFLGAAFNTSRCEPCPADSSTLGATAVASPIACLCDAGFVQVPGDGATGDHCVPCPMGQFAPQAGSVACAICNEGTFSDHGATSCFVCPEVGVECVGGALTPRPGFWRDPPDAPITSETEFLPCSPADVCGVTDGGTAVECASGHTGIMCVECGPGHGRFDNRCFECWSAAGSIMLLVVAVLIFGLLMWFVVSSSAKGMTTGSVLLKVVSTHIQCLLILMRFGWRGPAVFDSAARLLSAASGADLSLGMLFPLQCVAGTNYHAEQAMVLALPIVTIIGAWAVLGILVLVGRESADTARAQGTLAATVILFQMHSMVMRRIAAFLECEPVAGAQRHIEDYGTKCEGAVYTALLAADIVALVVFVFGVPAAGMYFVWRASKRQTLTSKSTSSRIGFLYVGYRLPTQSNGAAPAPAPAPGPSASNTRRSAAGPQSLSGGLVEEEESMSLQAPPSAYIWREAPTQFWGSVVFLRKLALVGCATFMGPVARRSLTRVAESDQAAMAQLVLLAAAIAHCLVQPYDRWQLNALELVSICALAATVSGAVAQGRDEDLVGAVAGLLHVAFLGGCAAYLVHRIRRRRRLVPRAAP